MPDLTALRRRFAAVTFLTWLAPGLTMPVMVLLMTARGLDLTTIGLVFVVHSAVVTALELPTGGLADVIGRRGVLAVSAALGVIGVVWMAVAGSAWEFVAVTVVRGVARALSSGPAEAWYVDAVHAVDRAGDIRTGLARGQAAGSIALAAGTVLGGAIPLAVPLPADGWITPLSVPVLLAGGVYAALLALAVLGMPEPPRETGRPDFGALFREVPRTIAGGVRLGVRNRALARLMLGVAVAGIALNAVELLTPGRMAQLTGDTASAATGYGIVTAVGFAASGLGSALTAPLVRLTRTERAGAAAGIVVAATGLLALSTTGGLTGVAGIAATGGGYALMFLGLGLAGPVRSELMHREVGARERATVVSIQSLVQQGGGLVAAVALPLLVAAASVPVAWAVSGVLLAGSAVLFRAVRKGGDGDGSSAAGGGPGVSGGRPSDVSGEREVMV